jgi:glycine/D-amino acid oxidase-like deaminating enzyme
MQVDVLIIGQGICGTVLGWYLQQRGISFIIIDDTWANAASQVASGLMNLVTGKRMVTTWLADALLPVALETYAAIEIDWGIHILEETTVIDFFATSGEREVFEKRMEANHEYLYAVSNEKFWIPFFNFYHGAGYISPCWILDIQELVKQGAQIFRQQGRLLNTRFQFDQFTTAPDGARYMDIVANVAIFCDGVQAASNPLFSALPFSKNKGEALLVSIPGLPRTNVFQQRYKIVPFANELFWVGSSFEWDYTTVTTTDKFYKDAVSVLERWVNVPFSVKDHLVGERPSTIDHKPFIGFHPKYPSVGILNGMGTKGCLQAPYFARNLAEHFCNGAQLHPEADIKRFQRILSR